MDGQQKQEIVEYVEEWADGLDDGVTMLGDDWREYAEAIIGVTMTPRPAVVYSASAFIAALARDMECSHNDAVDFYSYNTERAVGYIPLSKNPPILVDAPWT